MTSLYGFVAVIEAYIWEHPTNGFVDGVAVADEALLPAGSVTGSTDVESFYAWSQAPEKLKNHLFKKFKHFLTNLKWLITKIRDGFEVSMYLKGEIFLFYLNFTILYWYFKVLY